jgi:hypothetical protein
VELANGVCYEDPQRPRSWLDTKEEFQIFLGGAVAQQGPHQVILGPNINDAHAVDLLSPDGQRFVSQPKFLSFRDLATGKQVLIAEVKDCAGLLVPPNIVVYPDAFTDFHGAMRYTYTCSGLEQDVILFDEGFGSPEEYGLKSQSTVLEIWTIFSDHPPAQKLANVIEGELDDETLDFGAMQMRGGSAFALGNRDEAIPTGKVWERVDGQDYLIEAVSYPKLRPLLDQLKPQAGGKGPNERLKRLAKVVKDRSSLVAQLPAKKNVQPIASINAIERFNGTDPIRGQHFCADEHHPVQRDEHLHGHSPGQPGTHRHQHGHQLSADRSHIPLRPQRQSADQRHAVPGI